MDIKAAIQGDRYTQNSLGNYYQNGIGVLKDEKKAFEWYLKSANNGCALGQCDLGYCYENGIGIDKNETKAIEWYSKWYESIKR